MSAQYDADPQKLEEYQRSLAARFLIVVTLHRRCVECDALIDQARTMAAVTGSVGNTQKLLTADMNVLHSATVLTEEEAARQVLTYGAVRS